MLKSIFSNQVVQPPPRGSTFKTFGGTLAVVGW